MRISIGNDVASEVFKAAGQAITVPKMQRSRAIGPRTSRPARCVYFLPDFRFAGFAASRCALSSGVTSSTSLTPRALAR
jgi:hypothetical protein